MNEEPRSAGDEAAPEDESSEEILDLVEAEPTEEDEFRESEAEERRDADEEAAAEAIHESLLSASLGFVSFDGLSADNQSAEAMVSEERRANFRRDVYVGIRDTEQGREFLGRIVEGPFHLPHEVGRDSAITRVTVLHPERTQFRASYYVHGTIEVIGEIRGGEHVVPTPTRPRPYSEIYLFPPDRLQQMLGLGGEFFLGHLLTYESVQVYVDANRKAFLPRNVGVFGTVGSGKSNSVQVIMEEALAAGWAVVAIDVEGEYVRMSEESTDPGMRSLLKENFGLEPYGVADFRVYVPSSGSSDAASSTTFKVPIASLQADVIGALLEFSEPQVRLYGIATHRAGAQSGRSPGQQRMGALGAAASGGPPEPAYTLQDLIDGLTEDQSGNIPLIPRVRSAERNTAGALRSKLVALGLSGMLDWNATRGEPYLPINELLVGGRLSVLDVSETDDRSRNIAIAHVLQSLFDRVVQTAVGDAIPGTDQARPKLLVVIEEIHTFVARRAVGKMRAVIDMLQIISRRGRKRWMALALVSQQPGHVPDELFELTNTRFVHQTKSASNLAPIKQTTGGVHEALWSTVPSLGPGQALVSGSIFRNPLFLQVRPAKSRRLLID